MVVGPAKSMRSRRSISLPAVTVRVLQEHQARQEAERQALGPYWQDSGLVFSSTMGTVIEPRNLTRLLDALIDRSTWLSARIRVHLSGRRRSA
jgi:integrase